MARPQYDKPLVFFFFLQGEFSNCGDPQGKKKKKKTHWKFYKGFFQGKKNLHKSPYVEKKRRSHMSPYFLNEFLKVAKIRQESEKIKIYFTFVLMIRQSTHLTNLIFRKIFKILN